MPERRAGTRIGVPALLGAILLAGCTAGSPDAPDHAREGETRALGDAAAMLGEQRLAADAAPPTDEAQGDRAGTEAAP